MINVEATIKRLLKPPSVANWVRHNFKRTDRTRKGLLRFAKVPPTHSLAEVYSICAAIVTDQIDLEQADKCIDRDKDTRAKVAAREIVPLFYAFAKEQNLEGLAAFKGFSTPYPLGRGPDGKAISIPVTPTFTIIRAGALVPVFLIGWATLPLDDYQKALLSTIINDALLTQQDFLGSDALIICTPKHRKTDARQILTWHASKYATLSEDDLQDQFIRYRKALDDVARTLRSE